MIRKCYVDAEKLVWNRAIFAPKTGVILSGQPGIGKFISSVSPSSLQLETFVGKTLFIWFLLVRLLSMKQVVVLHIAGGGPIPQRCLHRLTSCGRFRSSRPSHWFETSNFHLVIIRP